MNIREIDEAQGLTGSMMRDWLNQHFEQWQFKIRMPGGTFDHPAKWSTTDGRTVIPEFWLTDGNADPYWADPGDIWKALNAVLLVVGRAPQDFLRDINPRMRSGMPSQEAWEAHGKENAYWLARWDVGHDKTGEYFTWFSHRPFITKLRMTGDTWEWGIRGAGFYCGPGEREDRWSFWPCDAAGNKVRWPVDEDGNML